MNENLMIVNKASRLSELDVFFSLFYVPLDTGNPEVQVGNILKVKVVGEYIYVLAEQHQARKLFKFDQRGKLLASIDSERDEKIKILEVSDFEVFDGYLYLTDVTSNKILKFRSEDLSYLESYHTPFNQGVKNFLILTEEAIVLRPEKPLGLPSSLYFANSINLEECTPIVDASVRSSQIGINYPLMNFSNFEKLSSNRFLYFDLFSAKVDEYFDDKLVKSFSVAFEQDLWISPESLSKFVQDDYYGQGDIVRKSERAYVFNFVTIDDVGNYLFSFTRPGYSYLVYADSDYNILFSKYVSLLENERNSIDSGPSLKYLVGNDSSRLIFQQDFEEIKLYQAQVSVTNDSISNIMEILSREDASITKVLVFADIKAMKSM